MVANNGYQTQEAKMADKKNWWGEGVYSLCGETSPYIAGAGILFLRKFRQKGAIADFGTWQGRNLPSLESLGGKVVATDTDMAKSVVTTTKTRFPNVRFFEANLDRLPFGDGEIGAAICWRVYHNLVKNGELVSAVVESNRVMAIGAPLLIAVRTMPHEEPWASTHAFVRRCQNGAGGSRDDVYFSRGALEQMAKLLGFQVVQITDCLEGGEEINGKVVKNHYLVAHLLKVKYPDSTSQNTAKALIVQLR